MAYVLRDHATGKFFASYDNPSSGFSAAQPSDAFWWSSIDAIAHAASIAGREWEMNVTIVDRHQP